MVWQSGVLEKHIPLQNTFPSLLRRQKPDLKRSFSCRAGSRDQNRSNQILDFIEN